jgi:hypothetical protein
MNVTFSPAFSKYAGNIREKPWYQNAVACNLN